MGQVVTIMQNAAFTGRLARIVTAGLLVVLIAGCNMFSAPKIKEEAIVPPDTLYTQAIGEMDKQNYLTAVKTLQKLERQHPNGEYSEKAKLMLVFAHYRVGKFDEAILAADRYTALYATSPEVPYVLYLKGNAYFAQIRDITRDQQISQNAIETYALIISNYPDSKYAKDAREKLVIGVDQRTVLVFSVLLGPALVLGADIVGRVITRPGELEVGVVTAFVGAPMLLALLLGRSWR